MSPAAGLLIFLQVVYYTNGARCGLSGERFLEIEIIFSNNYFVFQIKLQVSLR